MPRYEVRFVRWLRVNCTLYFDAATAEEADDQGDDRIKQVIAQTPLCDMADALDTSDLHDELSMNLEEEDDYDVIGREEVEPETL